MPNVCNLKLDYECLDEECLAELFKAKLELQEEKKTNTYSQVLEQCTLIEGKKGKGKTLLGVGISWECRERFGTPIVVVGTTMGLKEEYGPYTYLPPEKFRLEMEKLTAVADAEENGENVKEVFDRLGIQVEGAFMIFDEARKMLDSYKHNDKLVQLVSDWMSIQRHYHCTTLILAMDRDEIDKRVRRQVDWFGRAYYNKWTRTAHTRLSQGLDVVPISIKGGDDTEHICFQDMYDSWKKVGFRKSATQNVKI